MVVRETFMRVYSSKWNRALSAGLYVLILVSYALYTWVVLYDARETRIANALDRNQATAALGARFIDVQWRAILEKMDQVAAQEPLAPAVRTLDGKRAREILRAERRTVPELQFVSVYLPNGNLLASDPPGLARNARRTEWYRAVTSKRQTYQPYIGRPDVSDSKTQSAAGAIDKSIVVAVRLDKRVRARGFLVATVRDEVIKDWLRQLAGMDSTVYLADSQDGLVASSTGASPITGGSTAVRYALDGQPGGLLLSEPRGSRKMLVGYAGARTPRWAVLFVQSEAAVLDPTYALAARFAVLVVPLLVVISGVIVLLDQMYARQEKMTLQLEERNAELQQANQVRSDFLANVSHDLRTPLTTMSIALSGLLETEAAWGRRESRGMIQFVSEEVDLLEARVRNLLEMSRIEAKAQLPRIIPADLTDIVGGAMERLQPLLGSRQLLLTFPDEALLVNCDPAQIEIVVLNLLENAAKYSPPGTSLRLVGERRQDTVLFGVEDCGPGIDPGQEERIFEKFYRAPSDGRAHGTGLGLAICKAVVETHDGAIGAVNLPEGGARFWFTLPSA
jgi:signal transduction histidine kinase